MKKGYRDMVKRKKMGMSLILGSAMMVAGPVIAGCSTGVSADNWAATEGAIGRINMDAVQEAFEKSESVEEFEKRLNEIYEGDGIVLIRAKEEGGKRIIEAFEDLDNNNDIEPGNDDLLFSITNENNNNELRGVPQMKTDRTSYRNSTAYSGGPSGGQVSKNSAYYNKQSSANRSSYTSAGKNLSPARQSYIGNQKSSGAFKTSRTGVRSTFGKSGGRSGGGGGGRGGGGAQVIIGHLRS